VKFYVFVTYKVEPADFLQPVTVLFPASYQ